MPSFCESLRQKYEDLQKLTAEFAAKYQSVKEAGDLSEIKVLRKELERSRDTFFEVFCLFVISDAQNPYYQALEGAGVPLALVPERLEVTLDIRQEIQEQLAVYEAVQSEDGNHLLREWVEDIAKNKDLIYRELAKDRVKIEARIKAGMIPIVMPSRSVQERTWEVVLKKLKPTDGISDTEVNDGNEQEKKNRVVGFLKHVPDRPYLVWTEPSQDPGDQTRGKSFDGQVKHNAKLVVDRPNLYDSADLIPTEIAPCKQCMPLARKSGLLNTWVFSVTSMCLSTG